MSTIETTKLDRPTWSAWSDDKAESNGARGVADFIDLVQAPPRFPREHVRRPELVRRLREAEHAALALIVAPPGYGKTSLLAEWAEQDPRAFLWLRLHCAQSEREAVDGLGGMMNLLPADSEPVVVVLEDAHRVAPDLLHDAIEMMWKRLPYGSLVAVASRTEPDLRVGRWRAHRILVEIRTRDLAMAADQAEVLLRAAGLGVDFESAQTLVEVTEGWPAALYLAALSEQQHPDAPAGSAGFRGDDHLVAEYVHDDVIGEFPEGMLTFLRHSSVVDRLNGDLCDSVLERHGSGLELARVAKLTELLEPVDAAHEWFRWHPLLRESLQADLRRRDPDRKALLHQRACEWYAEHGDVERAIDQATAAQDAVRAGELLWEHIVPYVARGQTARVDGWLGAFGQDAVATTLPLCLCAAFGALMSGEAEVAQRWAREAAAQISEGAAVEGIDTSTLKRRLAVIDAAAGAAGIADLKRAAHRAGEAESANSPWRPALRWIEGVALHLNGERAAASAVLEEAAETAGHAYPMVRVLGLAQRAMVAIEDKDWDLALEMSDRASAVIEENTLGEPLVALAFAAAAAARAHEGRAAEAKHDLRAGIAALADLDDSLAWYGAETRILLAHASLYLADVVGARTLLAQASRLSRRTPTARVFEAWFDQAWSYLDTLAETSFVGPSALTIAELRVLRFLPSCRTFREIAEQLGVSANTVKTQAHAVYRKLDAASRSEAVTRARAAGLLGQ